MNAKDYDCPICISILTLPVTLTCNHHLCYDCYKTLTSLTYQLKCPYVS